MKQRSLMAANVLAILIVLDVSLMMLGFHLLGGRDVVQSLGPAPTMAGPETVSHIQPDGTGYRSIRYWAQILGKERIYHGLLLDNSRWVLTDAGAISCDAPDASTGWTALSDQERDEVVEACAQEWVRWAWAYPEHYNIDYGAARSWGPTKQWESQQIIRCNEMSGPVWSRISDQRRNEIDLYCNQPERTWQP